MNYYCIYSIPGGGPMWFIFIFIRNILFVFILVNRFFPIFYVRINYEVSYFVASATSSLLIRFNFVFLIYTTCQKQAFLHPKLNYDLVRNGTSSWRIKRLQLIHKGLITL